MELILDATPLIYITRANLWDLLKEPNIHLLTTHNIVLELKLEQAVYPEVQELKQMISSKKLGVVKPTRVIPNISGISQADASVVYLAKERRGIAVIDDTPAKRFAQTIGVNAIHTSALVINAVKKKRITPTQGNRFIDTMISGGWRCDIETYKNIINAIKTVE